MVTVSLCQLEKLQEELIHMQDTIKSLISEKGRSGTEERQKLLQLGYTSSDMITDNGKTFLKPTVWGQLTTSEKNAAREAAAPNVATKGFDWQKEILLKQGFTESDLVLQYGKFGLNKEAWASLSETQQEELKERLSTKPKGNRLAEARQQQQQQGTQGPPSPEEAERRKNVLRKLGFKDYDLHPTYGGLTPFKFKSLSGEEQKAVLNAMRPTTQKFHSQGEDTMEFAPRRPPPPMNVAQDIDDDDVVSPLPSKNGGTPMHGGEFGWERAFLEERGIKPNQLTQNAEGGWWFSEEVLQGEMSRARVATWRKRMSDFAAKNHHRISSSGDDEEDQEM
jgi:hypothetical protein